MEVKRAPLLEEFLTSGFGIPTTAADSVTLTLVVWRFEPLAFVNGEWETPPIGGLIFLVLRL